MIAIQTINFCFTVAGLLLLGGAACAGLWISIVELRERARAIESHGAAARRDQRPVECSTATAESVGGRVPALDTGGRNVDSAATLPRVQIVAGVVDRLVAGIGESLRQRGEQEIGYALVGTIEDNGDARVITINGLIDEGPAASYSGGHHTADRAYQQRELSLLQIVDERAMFVGDAHLHPGAMDRPSGGDYRTDLGSVRTSKSGELVFVIATAPRQARIDAAAGRSLYRDGIKLDFYYLGQASGYEYRHVQPQVVEGPALSIPGALRRFAEAHQPARVRLDLENLRRLGQYSMSLGELTDDDGPARLYIRMTHKTLGFNVAILAPPAPGQAPEVMVEDGSDMMKYEPSYLSTNDADKVWFTQILLDIDREMTRRRGVGGNCAASAAAGASSPPPAAGVWGTATQVQS